MAIQTKKKYTGQKSTAVLSGKLRIEEGNGRMVVYDASTIIMEIGLLSDGTYGVTFYNPTGSIISKNTGATQYIYDPTTGKNVMQIGKLPDGTYGMAVAKSGYNVADGIY